MIKEAERVLLEEVERLRRDSETQYVVPNRLSITFTKRANKGQLDSYTLGALQAKQIGSYLTRNREKLGLIRYTSDILGFSTRYGFGLVESFEQSSCFDRLDDVGETSRNR